MTGCLVKPLPTLQLLRYWSSHSRNRPTCSLALFKVGAPEQLGWAPRGSLQGCPLLSQFTDTLLQQPLFLSLPPIPTSSVWLPLKSTAPPRWPSAVPTHPSPLAAFGGWEGTPCSGSGEWGERSGWECLRGESGVKACLAASWPQDLFQGSICWGDLSFVGREGTQGSAHPGRGSGSLPGGQGAVSAGPHTTGPACVQACLGPGWRV